MVARAGDIVRIDDGVYRETVIVEQSGAEKRPIVFEAAPGANVVVTGADVVTEWQREPGDANVFSAPWPHVFAGWSPSNASFQSFITAMRKIHGEAKTKQWLVDMKANAPHSFASNAPIIQAIMAGEIDYGLPNHYYLLGFKKADDVHIPVDQTFFAAGDVGNLVNVAGVGILASSKNPAAAEKFVRFLLSPIVQQYFSSDTLEYPVIDAGIITNPSLVPAEQLMKLAPPVTLDDLDDMEGTLALLRSVGLL